MIFLRINQLGQCLRLFQFPKTCYRLASNEMLPKYAGVDRKLAEHHVYENLRLGQQCWAFEIENLINVVEQDKIADVSQVTSLMRACNMDIVDLFPKEQKLLTKRAWTVSTDLKMTSMRTVDMYNYMLEAYNFQEIDINEKEVLRDMWRHGVNPVTRTYVNFLRCYCRKGDIMKALEFLQARADKELPITEKIANHIIQCHASLGEWQAAEDIPQMLEQRRIHLGKSTDNAFILGFALGGDIGRMEKYMNKVSHLDDKLVLLALKYLCREWSNKAGFLLDKLPIDDKLYNAECRRTIKALIEMGQSDIAFSLVEKTRMLKENNTDVDRVIKALPTVLVFDDFVKSSDNIEDILHKVSILKSVDEKIVGRAVIRLINLVLENNVTIEKALKVKDSLHEIFPGELGSAKIYAKQNSKRRMQSAESAEEVLEIFSVFTQFGLRLDNPRTWDFIMTKLIPEMPDGDEFYTVPTLVQKCFQTVQMLLKISDEHNRLYTTSFIWTQIMQYLLNRERSWLHLGVFFNAAAEVSKMLKCAYGPGKWKISLANALLYTKEVTPFITIIEVSYKNIEQRGDISDFVSVTQSLVEVVKIGVAKESNYKGFMYRVLQELWARQIMIPSSVADKLFDELHKHDPSLASMVKNIKLIDEKGDVVSDFKLNKKNFNSKKFRRRKGIMAD